MDKITINTRWLVEISDGNLAKDDTNRVIILFPLRAVHSFKTKFYRIHGDTVSLKIEVKRFNVLQGWDQWNELRRGEKRCNKVMVEEEEEEGWNKRRRLHSFTLIGFIRLLCFY